MGKYMFCTFKKNGRAKESALATPLALHVCSLLGVVCLPFQHIIPFCRKVRNFLQFRMTDAVRSKKPTSLNGIIICVVTSVNSFLSREAWFAGWCFIGE